MKKSLKNSIVIVLITTGIAGGAAYWHKVLLDRAEQKKVAAAADVVAEAAKTKDYASVRKAVASGQIDRSKLGPVIAEEFHKQTLIRVNQYAALTDPLAKQQYIDKVIDEMEDLKKVMRKDASKPASTTAPTTAPATDWRMQMVLWTFSQPPAQQARIASFHSAMEARRAQRGMPSVFEANSPIKGLIAGGK